jgi:hypothetical protein
MKTYYISNKIKYTGEQLKPLYAYMNHGILGDSIIAWQGGCDIPWHHMVDGEDLRAQSPIAGDHMLHFLVEVFRVDLFSAVSLQRLLAAIVKELLLEKVVSTQDAAGSSVAQQFRRSGDDIYWDNKKLSISIASQSVTSCQIHFALNVSNEGTPVPTCSLNDFLVHSRAVSLGSSSEQGVAIDVCEFAHNVMGKFCEEFLSILEATQKVRAL